jgi:hypothetical protein
MIIEHISIIGSASPREKTAVLKEIEGLNKRLEELRVYECDVFFPLAVQRIQIDLDDGDRVNYSRFVRVLANIEVWSKKADHYPLKTDRIFPLFTLHHCSDKILGSIHRDSGEIGGGVIWR